MPTIIQRVFICSVVVLVCSFSSVAKTIFKLTQVMDCQHGEHPVCRKLVEISNHHQRALSNQGHEAAQHCHRWVPHSTSFCRDNR